MLWSGVGGQLLSYHFGGLYSANLRSRFSQQIFSADFLSRSSQQIFSADHLLWSGVGGQLLSYHLLWSGVGGQLLSYHFGGLYCMSSLEGPFRGAFGKNANEKCQNEKCWPHCSICSAIIVLCQTSIQVIATTWETRLSFPQKRKSSNSMIVGERDKRI